MIRDAETLTLLTDTVRRFVRERLVPSEERVAETDQIPDEIPDQIAHEMKAMGLYGMTNPEAFGGLGLTMEEEVHVLLELQG